MKRAHPRGLSPRHVEQVLSEAKDCRSTGSRIDFLSNHFLGKPYTINPLIGSADTVEIFTAALDGFDCVTYIEAILALARARDADDFIEWLRKIRYERGSIQWKRRNHYMTGWIRNNERNGVIGRISIPAIPTVSRGRTLKVIRALPAVRTRIECIPKRAMPRLQSQLQTGDLIFFVSTRKDLDVYHAGIIVRDGKNVLMRHASRSQGVVAEQVLTDFVNANRMTGVIVVRPRAVIRPSRSVTSKKRLSIRRIPSSQGRDAERRRG